MDFDWSAISSKKGIMDSDWSTDIFKKRNNGL